MCDEWISFPFPCNLTHRRWICSKTKKGRFVIRYIVLTHQINLYVCSSSSKSCNIQKAIFWFQRWISKSFYNFPSLVSFHFTIWGGCCSKAFEQIWKERLNVWGKNCSIVPPLCADEVGAVPEEGVTLLVPQEGAKGRGQVIVHVPWDNPSTQKNFIVSFVTKSANICLDHTIVLFRSDSVISFKVLATSPSSIMW